LYKKDPVTEVEFILEPLTKFAALPSYKNTQHATKGTPRFYPEDWKIPKLD
jgi:hypothetical protein